MMVRYLPLFSIQCPNFWFLSQMMACQMMACTTRALTKIIFLKVESINRLCNATIIKSADQLCLWGGFIKKKKKKVMSVGAIPRQSSIIWKVLYFFCLMILQEILEPNVLFHVTPSYTLLLLGGLSTTFMSTVQKKGKVDFVLFLSSRKSLVNMIVFLFQFTSLARGPGSGMCKGNQKKNQKTYKYIYVF